MSGKALLAVLFIATFLDGGRRGLKNDKVTIFPEAREGAATGTGTQETE